MIHYFNLDFDKYNRKKYSHYKERKTQNRKTRIKLPNGFLYGLFLACFFSTLSPSNQKTLP